MIKAKSLESFLELELEKLKSQKLYRSLEEAASRNLNPNLINFASHNYLGLNRKLQEIWQHGKEQLCNSTGSRLITGSHPEHGELEKLIADWKGCEAALCFSSGYAANLGALSALLTPKDMVIVDEYAHSCIWDGIKLSKARKFIFKHNDATEAESIIAKHREKYQKAFIVTESVFSMSGQRSPIQDLYKLTDKYEATLYVDEAHATGVFGSQGAGLISELEEGGNLAPKGTKLSQTNLIQMGTLSKAVASEGGYLAGSQLLIDFLVNKARSFIYSTALSPLSSKISLENIKLIRKDHKRRHKIQANIKYLRSKLSQTEQLESYQQMELNSEAETNPYWLNGHSAIFSIIIAQHRKLHAKISSIT